jgi:hypothetical protein
VRIQEILARQLAKRYERLTEDQLERFEDLIDIAVRLLDERDKALTLLAKLITGDYDPSVFEEPVFPKDWLDKNRESLQPKP